MKLRLILVLMLFSAIAAGQENLDHKIFSRVINSFMHEWDSSKTHLTNVVVIEKFKPDKNEVAEYIEMLYRNDKESDIDDRDWYLGYDTSLISLIEKVAVKKTLVALKKNFLLTPAIESENLELEIPFTLINSARYNRFFFLRKTTRGWNKFYKKFPKSAGVFFLSRIEYAKNYACLYVKHFAHGLHGSGRIIIIERVNNHWSIRANLVIWLA